MPFTKFSVDSTVLRLSNVSGNDLIHARLLHLKFSGVQGKLMFHVCVQGLMWSYARTLKSVLRIEMCVWWKGKLCIYVAWERERERESEGERSKSGKWINFVWCLGMVCVCVFKRELWRWNGQVEEVAGSNHILNVLLCNWTRNSTLIISVHPAVKGGP